MILIVSYTIKFLLDCKGVNLNLPVSISETRLSNSTISKLDYLILDFLILE